MISKIKTYKYRFVVGLALLLASLGLVWHNAPGVSALPTPPASGDALVETHIIPFANAGAPNQRFKLELWHKGLTYTADGIESTGRLSYGLRLTERFPVDTNNLRDSRYLFPHEESHSDGTYSYYVKYGYLPSTISDPQPACRNLNSIPAESQGRAYIGQKNRATRAGTSGLPYADWWDGWEVDLPYKSSNIGGYLCFEVAHYRPSGGTNWNHRIDYYHHRIAPPTLRASALTYHSGSQTYRIQLDTTLPTVGTFKVYKYSIAQVPKGTTSCNSDSFSFKAIAATDSSGRYTATISNSDKRVNIAFAAAAGGKTYCFAVWGVEGRRGVAGPVVIPAPQSVRIVTTGNKWAWEHPKSWYACPIPGFLGLEENTNYIMTPGGGGSSTRSTGINVLLNRWIRERFGTYSFQVKTQNGGPFTLADQLKYIHDALSYSDAGEQPGPGFALNNYRSRLYQKGVRDHKVSQSALNGLVHASQVAFGIELERPASVRTTVRYSTGGGTTSPATGTNKTSVGDYVLDGSEDYVVKQGDLVFEPGEYRKYAIVPIINDCVDDSDERLYLSINDPNGSTGDAALDRWFAANSSPVDYYIIKNHDGSPNANKKPPQPTVKTTPRQPANNDDDSDDTETEEETEAVWVRSEGAGGYCRTRGDLDWSRRGEYKSEANKSDCPPDKEWLPIGVCTRPDGTTYATLEPICLAENNDNTERQTDTDTTQTTGTETETDTQTTGTDQDTGGSNRPPADDPKLKPTTTSTNRQLVANTQTPTQTQTAQARLPAQNQPQQDGGNNNQLDQDEGGPQATGGQPDDQGDRTGNVRTAPDAGIPGPAATSDPDGVGGQDDDSQGADNQLAANIGGAVAGPASAAQQTANPGGGSSWLGGAILVFAIGLLLPLVIHRWRSKSKD